MARQHDLNFISDYEQIELIRHLEESATHAPISSTLDDDLAARQLSFDEKLRQRARDLGRDWALEPLLRQAQRVLQRTNIVACLVFGVLGAFAGLQAFPDGGQVVNFFWLLLLLLGTHLLMFSLWCIGLLWRVRDTDSLLPFTWRTVFKRALAGLTTDAPRRTVYQGWLMLYFQGRQGFWRLSILSHSIWLAFLCGGLLSTLLMLSARQYDFIWETTLLSESAFQQLTRGLGALPSLMGFVVPDADTVALSHRQADSLPVEARHAWASLLLSSLLIYGILLRGLALGLSYWQWRRLRAQRTLHLEAPYYVGLRQRLAPAHLQLGIVDPDPGQGLDKALKSTQAPTPDQVPPPDNAHWLGLELTDTSQWPPRGWPQDKGLGSINDRASRAALLATLAQHPDHPLVIVSDLQRTADRGLQRLLSDIKAHTPKAAHWLALIDPEGAPADDAHTRDRLSGWYSVAAQVGIPASHVFILTRQER